MTAPAPWERQEGETPRAWAAFVVYRDMGPARSYGKVRDAQGKAPGYVRQIEKWSSTNRWVNRVAAWDAEQDRVTREARLQSLRNGVTEMQERQVRAAQRDQAALDVIAMKLLERLERGDLDLLGQLDTMPAEDLVKLAALATRARKVAVQVEWAARGVSPAALSGESGDEDSAEEKALDQLIERMRAAPQQEDA